MEDWIRLSPNVFPWNTKWIVLGNNCANYARDGLFAGGIGFDRATPWNAIPNLDWGWYWLFSDSSYTSPRVVVSTSWDWDLIKKK